MNLMPKKPEHFEKTIKYLGKIFGNTQYAFRGTTSLVLQNIDMNIDDIDILTNKDIALKCNKLLNKYIKEKVKYQKSEKFKSYYGKFEINKIQVEIMGKWQIFNQRKQAWSKPFYANKGEITSIVFRKQEINVTKIKTELEMFMLMGRWNAYHKIKGQLPQDPKQEKLI